MLMTGAKLFISSEDGVSFQIPLSKGIRGVRIKLLPSDTYKVEFLKIFKSMVTVKSVHEGVYADQLQSLFTQETGLYTSLGLNSTPGMR